MYIDTITTNINFKSSKKTSYFILHTLNSVPLKVFHDVFIFVSFAMCWQIMCQCSGFGLN